MCALRAGSCAYMNPSSALAGPACRGQANFADCARFQALSDAQDQAHSPCPFPALLLLGGMTSRSMADMSLCHEIKCACKQALSAGEASLRTSTSCVQACKLLSACYYISKPALNVAQAAKQLYATRSDERQEVGSLVFNSFVFMQVQPRHMKGQCASMR